jgi:hypothetical protein
VEQAGTLRLTRLVDQRLADQLCGAGRVTGGIGRLRTPRQQQRTVHAGALLGVRHPVPQLKDTLQLQLGLSKGVDLLGGRGGLDAGGQGTRVVTGSRPVVGQACRPARRSIPSLQAGFQGTGKGRMQNDPLAGQQLRVDRLGQQRVAEQVAGATRLGQQHLLVDRLAQRLRQLLVVHAGDRRQQRLRHARAGRSSDAEQLLGVAAKPHHPGQEYLLQAWRQHAAAGALAGQQQLLGKERVALRTRIDLLDQPGGRVAAEQAGELLGHLRAGEPRQLQPLHAPVAGQLAQQAAQRVQAVQLVAAEGAYQHDPAGPEGGGQECQQVAGGAVGPVQVLQHPQQRPARGQPLHHAQQQLEQPPLAAARDRGTGGRLAVYGEVG